MFIFGSGNAGIKVAKQKKYKKYKIIKDYKK